jgi:hypothetical protein
VPRLGFEARVVPGISTIPPPTAAIPPPRALGDPCGGVRRDISGMRGLSYSTECHFSAQCLISSASYHRLPRGRAMGAHRDTTLLVERICITDAGRMSLKG